MKRKMIRFVSGILLLALLLSVFAMTVMAAEDDETGEVTDPTEEEPAEHVDAPTLLLYRDFGEGWDYKNGFTYANKDGDFSIDYEETDDFGYNYYFSIGTQGVQDDFVNTSQQVASTEYAIMQFDIKTKDYCSSGSLYARVRSGTSSPNIQMYKIQNGRLLLPAEGSYLANSNPSYDAGELNDDWLHLVYAFHFVDFGVDKEDQMGYADVTIYYGAASRFNIDDPTTYTSYTTQWVRTDAQTDYVMDNFELFRFGFPTGSNRSDYYCLDNVALYTGCAKPVASAKLHEEYGYGNMVNTKQAKVITILSAGGGEKGVQDYLNTSLIMKNNVEYALLNYQRSAIYTDENGVAYGAPRVVDGKVMLPLEAILNYIGYPVYAHSDGVSFDISTGKGASYITIGRDTASVNGERVELTTAPTLLTDEKTGKSYAVICADDVDTLFSGFYLTYDEMGLSIICEKENILNRKDNLGTMVSLMKLFVFDFPTGQQVYNDTKAKTNGFRHPYLFGTQESFDGLANAYQHPEEYPSYFVYANRLASGGRGYLNAYGEFDAEGNYIGLKKYLYDYETYITEKNGGEPLVTTVNRDSWANNQNLLFSIYETRYGGTNYSYDPDGGRNNLSPNVADKLLWMACAYMVTRDERYAEAGYDVALQLGTWESWGEGHFLNCADTTGPYSEAYDMFYNTWKQWGEEGRRSKTFGSVYSVDKIAQIIYDLGLSKGYISCHGNFKITRLTNGKQTISGRFSNSTNNWNAVCTDGMMMGALAIMEYCDEEGFILEPNAVAIDCVPNAFTTAKDQIFQLVETILYRLPVFGMDEYAPDGGYIESPGYWNYGTNSFFEMIWGMYNAIGDDYGLMDCWGIDTTCDFAVQTEYSTASGLRYWNYHDSGLGSQEKGLFYFVGRFFGNDGYIGIRKQEIDSGSKTPGMMDCLTYLPEFEETIDTSNISLSLDYYGEGIALACSRSSWNTGALYTGIMGEANNCSHNQVDAGNIYYVNKNVIWFCDLGSDNYNVYNYFGDSNWRNRYYKMGGEGQNHVIITSQANDIPYGQLLTGTGEMEEVYTNEYGSYAIMDLSSCYSKYVLTARRGMLYTNSRRTVVYQDEIQFAQVEDFAWIAHTEAYTGSSKTAAGRAVKTIVVSDDGRTAWITANGYNEENGKNDKPTTIRCSIVSTISSRYKFEVMDCYTYLLNTIDTENPDADNSLAHCVVDENNRHNYRRLVIRGTGASFELAVVVEEVDNSEPILGELLQPVEYDYKPMDEWVPVEKYEAPVDDGKATPQLSWIVDYTRNAARYVKNNYAFTTRYAEFFAEMHMVSLALRTYTVRVFRNMKEVYDAYEQYNEFLRQQQQFAAELNTVTDTSVTLIDSLCGFGNS